MDNNYMLGKRIRTVRLRNKLNQKDFAASLNVTPAHISEIELGKNRVSEQLLKLISLEYKVSYDWLLDGSGEMTEHSPEQTQRPLPDINAILQEALNLEQKEFDFNLNLFDNCLMNYKEYIGHPLKSEADRMNNEIIAILEKYMATEEILEEDLESKLWEFPNIAYTDGFLQGFQAGFTMFQYIQRRVSQ